MLIDALTALQDWAPVVALRHSRWIYASFNAAHIVGIALLFGAIVPLDLRLMGWRRTVPIGTMVRALLPVAIAGLGLAVVAGLALFSVRAAKYAGTGLFQVKMALVACALTNALLLKRAAQWEAQQTKNRRRATAALAAGRRIVDRALALGNCQRAYDRVRGLASADFPI